MWFGFYWRELTVFGDTTAIRLGKTNWFYSKWWTLRCWPCLKDGDVLPDWYMAIFDYFGYAKDSEEGIE